MTFDDNNLPHDINDDDVWWMMTHGFNAEELAVSARCPVDIAKVWMGRVAAEHKVEEVVIPANHFPQTPKPVTVSRKGVRGLPVGWGGAYRPKPMSSREIIAELAGTTPEASEIRSRYNVSRATAFRCAAKLRGAA